ncbi:unnamed protein product [Mytilus coruscus]|uniref:B box-type domain-containing protein n=1 Tax=Mytilus coruscus TaxID=42192 RepID=A0A6J8AUY0_MYTCO|nr:unnamed protein product [Mytilus coruscus]
MACSAQVPLCCQFCDNINEIKWKCFDCSLLLCDKCKIKLHSKVSFEKEHNIVDIRNVSQIKVSSNENLEKYLTLSCHLHSSKSCCLFCKTCDNLICPVCLLKDHKDHAFEQIYEAFQRKRTALEKIVDKIDKECLGIVQKEQQTFDELWSKHQHQQQKTKESIQVQTETLTSKILSYSSKILEQHDSFNNELNGMFESKKKVLDQHEQDLLDKRNKIETILNSSNLAEVFDHSKGLFKTPKITKPDVSNAMLGFLGGQPLDENVQQIFGSLVEIRPFKTYTTDLPDVGVIAWHGDYLWVANKEKKILQKIKPGLDLEIASCMNDIEISDFSITQSGELVLKLSKSNKLKMLSQNGKQKILRDFSSMKPTSVHVSGVGDVIVGVKENGPNFVLSGNSRRQLVTLTPSGKNKTTFEYDQNNKRLFTYVWNITSTSSGDICVIDRLSDEFDGSTFVIAGGLLSIFLCNYQKGPLHVITFLVSSGGQELPEECKYFASFQDAVESIKRILINNEYLQTEETEYNKAIIGSAASDFYTLVEDLETIHNYRHDTCLRLIIDELSVYVKRYQYDICTQYKTEMSSYFSTDNINCLPPASCTQCTSGLNCVNASMATPCTNGERFCITSSVQSKIERNVTRRCSDEPECRLNHLGVPDCLLIDTGSQGFSYDCHFCCVGYNCNKGPQIVPPANTHYNRTM